jgi:uncharacterized membrane protein YgaE (UPF0421/DUF939 family)
MTAPQTRTVDAHTGEVVMVTIPLRELEDLRAALAKALEDLDGSRTEVAHYADLNHTISKALERAADTAKNAVAQEQALRDDFDELQRDSDELWQRAIRVQELEARNAALSAELAAARTDRDSANAPATWERGR